MVVSDITALLATIPTPNAMTQISLAFEVYGRYPWKSAHIQDWDSLCTQVGKTSCGRDLELEVGMEGHGKGFGFLHDRDLFPTIRDKFSSSLAAFPSIKLKWVSDRDEEPGRISGLL